MKFKILAILALTSFLTGCNSENSSNTEKIKFEINETSISMLLPEGFYLIKDSEKIKEYPFPQDQKLYHVMIPINNPKGRYIAIGSKPYLDKHTINKMNFDMVKHEIVNELNNTGALGSEFETIKTSINNWRTKRGIYGINSVKMVGSKVLDDAFMLVVVVLNEDGTEFVSCTRMQHHKNKVVVMAVSSPYHDEEDIKWVFTTAENLDKSF